MVADIFKCTCLDTILRKFGQMEFIHRAILTSSCLASQMRNDLNVTVKTPTCQHQDETVGGKRFEVLPLA